MLFLSRRTVFLLGLLSLVALLSGCAGQQAAQKGTLWHSRDQFVALVDRDDRTVQGSVPNQHPVSLSVREMRAELATLLYKPAGKGKPVRVFDDPELQLLTEQLSAALQKATPEQDAVFAVYGKTPILKNFASLEVVTTGRAFYRDNRLNLLLGMLREDIKESDRRLQPFVPASRVKPSPIEGELSIAFPNAAFAANRPDWVILPVRQATADEPVLPEPKAEEKAAPPAKTGAVNGKDFEERLRVLGELKAKGLITEEEYRAKKESILKEL